MRPSILLLLLSLPAGSLSAKPIPVTVDAVEGMKRGGQPYFVKGAGGEDKLSLLAQRGANSIRTWSTERLDRTLAEAEKSGLTVSAGIWLEPECSWFSYRNPAHCARQTARVKTEVLRWREHPALLAWGLGNEAEGDGTNTAYWQQLDRLAVMVHEIDPAHPTFTAVAGLGKAKAAGMNAHAPNLDYVGINTYGGLFSLRKTLKEVKWTRPWIATEWGPQGFWERPKGPGGMPLEQTSTEKADMMEKVYAATIAPGGACMGSYAFVWGWKFEATSTWFGLLTHGGETTASVDALQQSWTGKPPANSAPAIQPLAGVPATAMAAGTTFTANTSATDPEGDALTWKWTILPEAISHDGSRKPAMPPAVPDTIQSNGQPQVTARAPAKPGRYRLHVEVSDGKGHAATANAPLLVE
jgi:hypothetical protein